ncbi:APC membrane recruitment protein 2 [Callorhinchus milii]|uniref:APC membrane recruitment protein 2 n=1 Tax=Callorhinchus milii TaxID=7868 RepID=UPI001C3FE26A|nr:APC membrane recruitment protein 2 [Callorhinchus milii]
MDLHCDCNDTPASEQPSGKINKTAFKLFGKRKSGSTIPSIFGVKNKGDGKGSAKMGLVRSKTHDGIADMGLEAGNTEGSLSNYHLETDSGLKIVSSVSFASGGCGTVAKSHSFFSLLRKNSKLENGKREANSEQVRDKSCNRQKKGLKGLFSSMRWHKKEKVTKEEKAEFLEIHGTLLLPGSLTASLECVKEEMQKSSSEPQIATSESQEKSFVPCEMRSGGKSVSQAEPGQADCGKSHPELCGNEDGERDAKDGHASGQTEESGTASEVEQVNWDEALNGKRQDPPEEKVSPAEPDPSNASQSAEPSGPGNEPPAEQSIDRICLMFSDVTSLKSFDSLTGCGDIIADQDDEGNGCERGAVGEKGKSVARKNSNVLTYQGGGEEMASPEEVDDEYLQEFWETPPPTAEPLKEKQQQIGSDQPAWLPPKDTVCFAEGANSTLPKLLALNEISVSKSDNDDLSSTKNDQQEGVPNSDEGYWDSTTPGPDDESGKTLVTRNSIPRDSYSGDALYDLFADPDESLTGIVSDEEMSSLSEPKALPPKTLLPVFNASVVPKDRNVSAIPKQKGSLTVCQENSNNTPLPHKPQQLVGCEPTRTKIPVAKTSIPRPTNKATTGANVRSSIAYGRSRK